MHKKIITLILIFLSLFLLILSLLLLRNEFAPVDQKALVYTEKLVYTSDASGNKEIYTMNINGTNTKRLTFNQSTDEGAFWSPDGTKIVFKSDRNKQAFNDYDLYIMDADGNNVKAITNYHPSHERGASFNPDGSKISFSSNMSGNFQIYTINIDGTGLKRITNNNHTDTTTHWSPDGSTIAYTSRRVINGQVTVNIYATNINTGQEVNLTNHQSENRIPAWSPDGKYMAFRSNRFGKFDLMVMNKDGTNQRRLSSSPFDDLGPAWSPDSKKIAFSSTRHGFSDIYIINSDGTNEKRLTTGKYNEDDIDWGLVLEAQTPTNIANTATPTPTSTTIPTLAPTNTVIPTTIILPSNTPVTVPSATSPAASPTTRPTTGITLNPTLAPTIMTGNVCGKADVDGDGVFTIADFAAFARVYGNGKNICVDKDVDYGPCGGRDVNKDGKLDIFDFGFTGIGFAQRYYPKVSCAL